MGSVFKLKDGQGRPLLYSDLEALNNDNISKLLFFVGLESMPDNKEFVITEYSKVKHFIHEVGSWCDECITTKMEGEFKAWEIHYDNPEDSYIKLKLIGIRGNYKIEGWIFHWGTDPSNPAALHFTNRKLRVYVGEDYEQKWHEIRSPRRKVPWQAINRQVVL